MARDARSSCKRANRTSSTADSPTASTCRIRARAACARPAAAASSRARSTWTSTSRSRTTKSRAASGSRARAIRRATASSSTSTRPARASDERFRAQRHATHLHDRVLTRSKETPTVAHPLFDKHRATLERALTAIAERSYWSAFAESPSPKIYGEGAAEAGKAAFDALRGKPYDLGAQVSTTVGAERSPFGFDLGITYPAQDLDALFADVARAQAQWRNAGPEAWVGVCLEILARLNQQSFLIANAVMHTTGQAFMMAFQAAGPHAQDRGLEAVAYAYDQMRRVPADAQWDKPQGKHDPVLMHKHFRIVPRGVGLVIGCCTFPTWNGYPGLFASLATGNAVVIKPHPGAILPLAISVDIARDVLREAGYDSNVVTLVAHDAGDDTARALALRPEVKLIDFTGSSANGEWLERNARQASVYTEKAGVNQVIVDSTDDLAGLARNLAFSLSLYAGQMCTAP